MSEQVKELGASRASSDAAEDAAPMGLSSLDGFTPGPWSVRFARNGSGDVGICAEGVFNVIAECFADMRRPGERACTEALANARLIAAAPELLEACRWVASVLRDDQSLEVRLLVAECNRAISKAEGAS